MAMTERIYRTSSAGGRAHLIPAVSLADTTRMRPPTPPDPAARPDESPTSPVGLRSETRRS